MSQDLLRKSQCKRMDKSNQISYKGVLVFISKQRPYFGPKTLAVIVGIMAASSVPIEMIYQIMNKALE